jgi:hypothetical protein
VLEYLSPRVHEPPPGTIPRLSAYCFGGFIMFMSFLVCLAMMASSSTYLRRALWSIPAGWALLIAVLCAVRVLRILRVDVYGGNAMDPRLNDD